MIKEKMNDIPNEKLIEIAEEGIKVFMSFAFQTTNFWPRATDCGPMKAIPIMAAAPVKPKASSGISFLK